MRALSTTRNGGFSRGPYRSLNLGTNSGDNPAAVARNRDALRSELPAEPVWLRQVHEAGVLVQPGYLFDLNDEGTLALSTILEQRRFAGAMERLFAVVERRSQS